MDIDKWRTSSYHPAGNGVLERFHGTLNSIIGRTISATQQEWDLLLPYVMAAYRASRHEATGYTPNYLVMGREVDIVYGAPMVPPPVSFDSYANELVHRLQTANHIVREELKTAATRYKRQYDARVKPHRFPVGSWTWYFNPRKHPGRQEKGARKYEGPYLVVRELGSVNVLLQKSRRSQPLSARIDKLKPYEADVMPQAWVGDVISPDRGPVCTPGAHMLSPASARTPMNGAAVDAPVSGTSTGDIMVLGTPKTPVTSFQAREPRIGRGGNFRPVSLEASFSAEHQPSPAMVGIPDACARTPRPKKITRKPKRFTDFV